ncbi:MAG TPA: hypothetical protein DCM14_07280 [Clostridiales bacterium UBA8153]|nr:hypothetical protein [Clostridiales bacterium UBA8153]
MLMLLAAAAPAPPKWGFVRPVDHAVSGLFVTLIMLLLTWTMISRARAGLPIPAIRKIAGLDAIDEAVGRATEMGRPVHISDFASDLGSPTTWAFWAYLAYTAKICAQYDTRIVNCNRDVLVVSVNEEIIQHAYLEAGRPDAFNRDDIRFYSPRQFAWAAAVCGMMVRERPAANLLIGAFAAESLVLAETGNLIKSIQVAGTDNVLQLPFFMVACDYTLIGEEVFAGAAYLSREPVIMGTVVAQDVMKVAVYILFVLGILGATFRPGGRNPLDVWLRF